ncbi:MAG: bifunctional phosphopantothenoylcysteine decarboxylase/phosphopantothenate--cysteine ligase CoaBC [Oscillospiraceae bacterium]
MLKNKTILLCVTGGIAAYKALEVTSQLVKLGANVKVIMTKSATEFVTPLSFQSLSQNPVHTDMFLEPKAWEIQHIALAKSADVVAIVPCTANVIGKIANGMADDLLTTTVMATNAPILIAPAMNTGMFENPILKSNISKLLKFGYHFTPPATGRLACGDTGFGKLADINKIIDDITTLAFLENRDLRGHHILVTAGGTQEDIDPVRFITNRSSGKMGFAIAKAAYLRGAVVTLIAASNICTPHNGINLVSVKSANEMYEAVMKHAEISDIIIKAAAVADFKPSIIANNKIKKNDKPIMNIELVPNPDILKELGQKYGGTKILVGFCMETENLAENAKGKLVSKNLDFIVANNLFENGAGFGTDTNVVTIYSKNGDIDNIKISSKFDIANKILDKVLGNLNDS